MKMRMRICVAGGAGFIGSHLAKRLKEQNHYVVVADIKYPEYFSIEDICDEFHLLDLKSIEFCIVATRGCDWVFNMAAVMGGMGCIQSNNGVILYANTMISFNMLESCRRNMVDRYFFSSSACIYPEHIQKSHDNPGLKEDDAWPAQPQDSYGLEKLCSEQLCIDYRKDFGVETRIGRFHNIYGPQGTWNGGKEKAPAAMCRKALVAEDTMQIWGDGKQTRSFCYIDDCIEGVMRLMESDCSDPINIGSDEMVTIDRLAQIALDLANKKDVLLAHAPGPIGVNGRNSNNDKIFATLGWKPSIDLVTGMSKTIEWMKDQIQPGKEEYYRQSFVVELSPDVYCKTH